MDIGMSELLVIGIVALIVIGPRDLPEMFRQLGRMTAKMRGMAREFNRAMEQAANETGVKDVAKDLKAMTSPQSMGLSAVKGAVDKFEKWDPIKNAAKPTTPAKSALVPAPMPATPVASVPADPSILPPVAEVVAETAPVVPVPAPAPEPAHGPNTAALYEKKAAREAILAESAAKLRALNDAPDSDPVAAEAKPKARKKAAPAVVPEPDGPDAVAKPSPRKRAAPAAKADSAAVKPAPKTTAKKKAAEE